jgi:hypothetical protein
MEESKNKQQISFIILLASILGIYFGGNWLFSDIKTISTLWELDMEISWMVYIPLLLFYSTVFLFSFFIFVGSILEFKSKEFLEENSWKPTLILIAIFNLLIVLATLLNEYILNIQNEGISSLIMISLLLGVYYFGAKKQKLNPTFFLVSLVLLTGVFWSIVAWVF